MALVTYAIVKTDCRFILDDDDDDYQVPMFKRGGSALAAEKSIIDLPQKEIMEISVNKFDPELKQAFYDIYGRLNNEDRDTVEFALSMLTLKSLKNCPSLNKPFKPGERELAGILGGVMKLPYKTVLWGMDKKDKEVLKKVEKQIESNGSELCKDVGK